MDRRRFLQSGAAAALGLGVAGPLAACTTSSSPTPGTTTPGSTGPGPVPGSAPSGTAVPAGAVADLRRKLRGSVLVPGDPGYDVAGRASNARYNVVRPAVIAQCADEADVATSVRWSRDNGVPTVGRGGGHNYAGLCTTSGLLIDLGRLDGVTADRGTAMAVVGGAAKNRNVYDALHDGPLLLPGGTCLTVGVGGLVLGGGIGYNSHWAGLTSDRLRATRMVAATGEVIQADATTNADLFWACRGATGGQFGIHTQFTFELVEAPAQVAYYRYEWQGAEAATAVLAAFDTLLATAPAAFNAVAMAQATPVGAGGPREAITVMSRGQHLGPRAELEDLVRPLLAAAAPTKTTLEEKPYWDQAKVFLNDEGEPHSWGDISRYAKQPLPADVWAKQVDTLVACPSRTDKANGSLWLLGWVGGPVIDAVGRTDTAYVHRGMHVLVRSTPVWPADAPAAVGDALMDWTDEMIAIIDPHTPRESYQNFPNLRITDWPRQYYAENLERLVRVKAAYDPDDVFTNAQGIPTHL